MTRTSTFKFFVQDKVENSEISVEQIKEITAVITQPINVSSRGQQKAQAHQAVQAAFDGLRQSMHEAHAQHRLQIQLCAVTK